MGSNSNRSLTREEKIGKFAKSVAYHYSRSYSEASEESFQSNDGARIRGEMGVERGNAFIEAIKNTTSR